MRFFRRKEIPWEVVGSKGVEPIPMYDEDEDIDILRVSEMDMTSKFVLDIQGASDMRTAIRSARHQLMQNLVRRKYNIMLSEGWRITILRKGKKYRVEVIYSGRPAYAVGMLKTPSRPPFIDVLDFYRQDLCTSCP